MQNKKCICSNTYNIQVLTESFFSKQLNKFDFEKHLMIFTTTKNYKDTSCFNTIFFFFRLMTYPKTDASVLNFYALRCTKKEITLLIEFKKNKMMIKELY